MARRVTYDTHGRHATIYLLERRREGEKGRKEQSSRAKTGTVGEKEGRGRNV